MVALEFQRESPAAARWVEPASLDATLQGRELPRVQTILVPRWAS